MPGRNGILEFVRRFSGLINFVVFQGAWFACVLGAAGGNMWVGPLAVVVLIPPQVIFFSAHPTREAIFVLVAGLVGFLGETAMTYAGVHDPVRQSLSWPLAPLWMVALWVNFASSFSLSLNWLKGRYALAAVMGAVAGPVAFYAGERMGAIVIHADPARGYGVLGVVWGCAVPGLFLIYDRLVNRSPD